LNNVILVVDMVKGFHNIGNLANPRTAIVIPNIRDLLERKMKEGGWRVLFLTDTHQPDDKEFDMFPPHCIEGSAETEVVDELQEFCNMGDNTVCPKSRFSGFFKTGLESFLDAENPEKVIVVGVCTDICVLYTAAGLRERDYRVIVPKDCVETYKAPRHSAKKARKWTFWHMREVLGVTIVKSQKET